ncbi:MULTISPECIES: FAS1-like dehydratase domain-containing protein [Prauserella salsuginis group]|uniref:UPF0336 protein FB384_001097 n=2 Tax=Prauserella salsuginis group TaxID=2893672 RepID=A0A839XNA8_9PSEU|nr:MULTISPECIES: MaoC family dehydratase N-terminal domain-containing protein [Prauserella salsuginis group]MBB3662193.1 acyl dehydratase [Prauserella sediminis]MCR3719884.1 Acyl dehydratase [Prauserella flava]MCR3736573.1 Acyl dehydratase [Prauserella salsuginis]
MPLEPSFIGRTYPPETTYEVGRAKIAEFARAIGDDNPLYRDVEAAKGAGYADVIAPPTFLTIINIRAINAVVEDPELGLDYDRMVHGDQRFVHHRPARAGDRLQVTVHIDDIFVRAGNDFLSVHADVATDEGEPVCTTYAQLVVRGEQS